MAMDFPAAPANGATFTDPVSGAKYTFNGVGWTINGGGDASAHTIGDTLPATASHGDLHWESDTGILWIYYTDADSSQWVQAAGSGGGGGGAVDVYTKAESDAKFVELTGDTMTGPLTTTALTTTGNVNSGARLDVVGDSQLNGSLQVMGAAGLNVAGASGISASSGPITASGNIVSQSGNLLAGLSGNCGVMDQSSTTNYRYMAFNGAGWCLRYEVILGQYELWRGSVMWTEWRGSDGEMVHHNYASMPGGGPWLVGSDARIKTVTGAYTQGLATIKQLTPSKYVYKGNDVDTYVMAEAGAEAFVPGTPHNRSQHYEAATTGKEFVGLVAQDVEAIMPEMVTQRPAIIDGVEVADLRVLNTNALTYALINAVKELSTQNEALTARIAALEAGA